MFKAETKRRSIKFWTGLILGFWLALSLAQTSLPKPLWAQDTLAPDFLAQSGQAQGAPAQGEPAPPNEILTQGEPAAPSEILGETKLAWFWLNFRGLSFSQQITVAFGAVLAIAVLVMVFCAWVFRKKIQNLPAGSDPRPAAPRGQKAWSGKQASVGVPKELFPDQWFEGIDQAQLDAYLEKAARQATGDFFSALEEPLAPGEPRAKKPDGKPPEPKKLAAAKEKLSLSIQALLDEKELLEILNSNKPVDPKERHLLALHLRRLLWPISLPRPKVSAGEIRPLAVGLMALFGALAGNFLAGLGSMVSAGDFSPRILGLAAGAFLGSVLAIFLSQNTRARRILLAGVGGLAFLDALSTIFSGAFLAFIPGLGKSSIFKRLPFYLGAMLVLLLVKSDKAFDQIAYRDDVSARVFDYLTGAIPVMVVLMYRLKETAGPVDEKPRQETNLLSDLAQLVSRLGNIPEVKGEPSFQLLGRKLKNAGFETQSPDPKAGPRILDWHEGLSELYDSFGLIENGRRVVIEEEPVF
ncbi:MAG: hypothetical protein LBF38_07975, partial [Deltaproteobacteria bacterium]|nr:hypothetical protein [Deltaproteobacteria bacterium]